MKDFIKIDKNFIPAFGKIFSPLVLNSIIEGNHSPFLSEIVINSGIINKIDPTITIGEFYNGIYSLLEKKYRNEYVYKNIIANKILLGKHNLNTAQMLMEFRVGKNKADVVILNGTSNAYEIKTQYDKLTRLENQIRSYSSTFEFVNVLISPSKLFQVEKVLPGNVGIFSYSDKNTISTHREPQSNLENLEHKIIFTSLRKYEYLNIIKSYFGYFPQVPNTKIFSESINMFCEIPIEKVHEMFIGELKKRNDLKILKESIVKLPKSLFAYILSRNNDHKQIAHLAEIINEKLIYFINTT